ncbi:MAG: hypothetical protein U0Q12_24060 [Vicinamibacterales bacterium]
MTAGGKLFPGLLAGVFIGVVSALPVVNFVNCCCLWVLTGGALASYLYQQQQREPMTPGDGLLVGLVAGLVGATVGALVSIPIQYVTLPFFQSFLSRLLETAEDVPPVVQELVDGLRMSALGTVVGFFFSAVVNAIVAPVGGLFGALFFRSSSPPPPAAPPAPTSPAPPPPPLVSEPLVLTPVPPSDDEPPNVPPSPSGL